MFEALTSFQADEKLQKPASRGANSLSQASNWVVCSSSLVSSDSLCA